MPPSVLVDFPVHVDVRVGSHRIPVNSARVIEAPVNAAEPSPVSGDGERLAHMDVGVELGKVLPLHCFPSAVQVRLAQVLGQGLQRLYVTGVSLHEDSVVRDLGLDEHIIVWVLTVFINAVDEETLYVVMARAARVTGVVDARAEIGPRGTAGRGDVREHPLGERRGLLEANHVVLLPLVLIHVVVRVAVAELDGRAVRERERLRFLEVFGEAVQLFQQRLSMVAVQLGERATQQQELEPRIPQGQQDELAAKDPALAAAPGTAVCDARSDSPQELVLLWVLHALKP